MPSFYISSHKYLQFDSFSFTVSEDGKDKKLRRFRFIFSCLRTS
jgi:hypothetical protein